MTQLGHRPFLQPIKSTSLTYGSPVADDVFSLV
jgi:hypothetical protein